MSLLSTAWRGAERRALSVVPQDLWRSVIGFMSATGITVTPKTALQSAVVWSCVRVLAESVAGLPLHVFRRRDERGKDKAFDYFLYPLLHTAPNEEMTSFEFRETQMGHLTLWGNAYSEIVYNNAGVAAELWPLRPDRMEIRRINGELSYVYQLPESVGGGPKVFDRARIMHLRGLGFDGLTGYSVIRYHREAIGLDMATREFGGRFFGNDARPGMVLKHPGVLSDQAHSKLMRSWESRHQGLDKSHRTAILEEGMDLQEIGMPLEDAQFLETRKYERTEIAGLFRVPPHMVADLERATFSNIEHQDLAFVKHSLRSWLVRWEQRMDLDLIPPEDRGRYFTKHNVDGLLRGDSTARGQYFRERFNVGSLTPNDIRELEDENPIEGGDEAFIQLNMIPLSSASQALPAMGESSGRALPAPEDDGHESRHWNEASAAAREMRAQRSAQTRYRMQQAQMRVYRDAAGRVLRREANDVGNAAERLLQRSAADFENWLREFYEEHAGFVAGQMLPVARAYAEMLAPEVAVEVGVELTPALEDRVARFVTAYVREQGNRHAARNEAALRKILVDEGDDAFEAVTAQLETWRDDGAAQDVALEESVRAGGAVAKMIYVAAGVSLLRWRAVGDTCPYCSALDGQVVGVTEYFLVAGEEFQPDGAEKPLTTNQNRGHPPAHRGCDCLVSPG